MSAKPAPKSDSLIALTKLIKSTAPGNLQSTLLTALPGTSEAQRKVLSDVLAPLAQAAKDQKHCVRCHSPFYEHENHPDACAVEHNDDPGEPEHRGCWSDPAIYTLSCCDEEFEEDDEPDDPICYRESHTTDPTNVIYYDEDSHEQKAQNENVITCEENGCKIKKRKAPSKGKAAASTKKKKRVFLWL